MAFESQSFDSIEKHVPIDGPAAPGEVLDSSPAVVGNMDIIDAMAEPWSAAMSQALR